MTTSRKLERSIKNEEAKLAGRMAYTGADTEILIDLEARRILGISGDEFKRRYFAGEYDEHEDMHRVLDIAFMLGSDIRRRDK